MKKLLLIVFTLSFKIIAGQELNIGIDFSDKKNNITHKYLQDKLSFFSLTNIENIQNKNIIRFWNTSNCVEIETFDDVENGKIVFAIQNTDNNLEFQRKEIPLNKLQVQKIRNLIEQNQLYQLPTGEKIKNWTSGFDGNLYEIESITNGIYQFKSYWTPSIQTVPEAKKLISFYEELQNIVDFKSLFKNFLTENEFSCYRYFGTAYSVCKIYTKKESRRIKRIKKRKK